MDQGEQEAEVSYDWRLLGWILGFIWPYRAAFLFSLVLMPLNTAMVLARRPGMHPPSWLAHLLRLAGPGHGLAVIGGIYTVLLVGDFASFYGQFYLTMVVAQYSLSDLRLALFRHVERLPMAFFDRNPVGRLVSRMTTDIDAINEMFGSGSLTLLMDLLTLTGIVVIMFSLDPRLALWAMCAIPPLTLILRFFQVRARRVYRDIR